MQDDRPVTDRSEIPPDEDNGKLEGTWEGEGESSTDHEAEDTGTPDVGEL